MARQVHITNGDSVAGSLRESGIDGSVLAWRDVLCEGPLPAGDDERFAITRARYLAASGYAEEETARQELEAGFAALREARAADEVVLWFEHDLHDQVQLVFLLDWFARQPGSPASLSLVSIDRYPGVDPFHGLGQLRPDQLAGLFPARTPITGEVAGLATAAWAALTSPTPERLNLLQRFPDPVLPFLAAAMRRYLEEYPALTTGLSRTEQLIGEELAAGPRSAGQLFDAVQEREAAPFLGDWSFWRILRGLARFPTPLLTLSGEGHSGPAFPEAIAAATPVFGGALAGRRDWIALAGVDRWHGGVHLAGHHVPWRWDPHRQQIVPLP